jgi:hypothetical protein
MNPRARQTAVIASSGKRFALPLAKRCDGSRESAPLDGFATLTMTAWGLAVPPASA